ncbi:hypothetical protein D3C78_1044130 [compost metagenome]
MVSDYLECYIVFFFFTVFHSGKLSRLGNNRLEQIGVEVGIYILQDGSKTFEPCACINIFIGKRCVAAVFIVIELREYKVPHFKETFIFSARITFRIRQIAICFATVIENFCTRSARAFANIPEVILQLNDPFSRKTNLLIPELVCFFILRIHSYRQTFRIKANPLFSRQKLPCPRNCFFLEIIANGEIAKHFKKSVVTTGFPYVFDIIRTNTFLRISKTWILRFYTTVKILLKRRHTGIDP